MKNTDTSEAIFITGIDTDAGKTYATASYARLLENMGLGVVTQKFIQTGCSARRQRASDGFDNLLVSCVGTACRPNRRPRHRYNGD